VKARAKTEGESIRDRWGLSLNVRLSYLELALVATMLMQRIAEFLRTQEKGAGLLNQRYETFDSGPLPLA